MVSKKVISSPFNPFDRSGVGVARGGSILREDAPYYPPPPPMRLWEASIHRRRRIIKGYVPHGTSLNHGSDFLRDGVICGRGEELSKF